MTDIDIDHLRQWIGHTDDGDDVVTPRLAHGLRATLDQDGPPPASGAAAPSTIHWCLAPPTLPMAALGPDGHPARGGFLPPVPLPRRMWAGGRLETLAPLLVGDTVTRHSRIADVVVKQGRTGTLCFVTVDHEISTARGVALRERQDIVYRDIDRTAPSPSPLPAMPRPRWTKALHSDPVLLFRYSALTFNGHRIHYDRDYCRVEEGYPGLIVHGPLQATWLIEFAADIRDGQVPGRFDFRGVHPLFDGTALTLNAVEDDSGLSLWVADHEGRPTMTATARW